MLRVMFCFFILFMSSSSFSQINYNEEDLSPSGDISLFGYAPSGTLVCFFSASVLFDAKKESWQNSVHFDVQTLDLGGSYEGVKNFYTIQIGKNYSFQHKRFLAKSCSGFGPFLYQRVVPGIGARSWGIAISQSLEIGVSLRRVDITSGFYLSVGPGYLDDNDLSNHKWDWFAVSSAGNPFIKLTFKN